MKLEISPNPSALRRRAENRLKKLKQHFGTAPTEKNGQRAIHELQVHKIELEMIHEELIKSNAALQAERDLFSDIYVYAPVGYFNLDQNCVISKINIAGAKLFGFERSYLVGKPFGLFLSRPTLLAFNALLQKTLSEEGKQFDVVEIRNNDQNYLTIQLEISYLSDEKGFLVAATDISALQQANNNLQRSNEQNEILLNTFPFPVDIVDRHGNVLYQNPQMIQAVNKPTEGRVCGQHHKETQQSCSGCQRHQSIQVGKITMVECAAMQSGKFFEIYQTGMIFKDKQALMEIFVDTSGRIQIENLLLASKNRMQAILDQTSAVIYTVDMDGIFTFVNEPCAKLFSHSYGSILGRTFSDFLPRELANEQRLNTLKVLQRGEQMIFEEHLIEPDGVHDYLSVKFPLRDETGTVIAIGGISTNVTERKRLENKHEQLQKHLTHLQKMECVGQLAGGIAHDFNNMLGVILSQAELALAKLPREHPAAERLREIIQAGEHSANLTRQLLTFARKELISPKTLELNGIMDGMLTMLRRLIGQDIDITWFARPGLWNISMDPSQLEQLLVNLVINARDAISCKGNITITMENAAGVTELFCDAPGDYVLISVSDDGCGMDTLMQSLIFEPYYTSKEAGKGTGLGLATVDGIVDQNHGYINVSSTPGEGTTFNVYLPRDAGEVDPPCTDLPTVSAEHFNITVLLVEDEPLVMESTRGLLEHLGCKVLAAASPEEAIELADNCGQKIDLLLTDLAMPKMNGHELIKQLNLHRSDLKCLLMSGYTAALSSSIEEMGSSRHFIQKPFMLKNLAEKLREALNDC